MQKILLLEDDLNLNRGIALLLSREGYEVRQVYTIKEAKEAFQKEIMLLLSAILHCRMVQDWIWKDGTCRWRYISYLSYGFGSGNNWSRYGDEEQLQQLYECLQEFRKGNSKHILKKHQNRNNG